MVEFCVLSSRRKVLWWQYRNAIYVCSCHYLTIYEGLLHTNPPRQRHEHYALLQVPINTFKSAKNGRQKHQIRHPQLVMRLAALSPPKSNSYNYNDLLKSLALNPRRVEFLLYSKSRFGKLTKGFFSSWWLVFTCMANINRWRDGKASLATLVILALALTRSLFYRYRIFSLEIEPNIDPFKTWYDTCFSFIQ